MIGKGWKLAALFLVVFLMGFVVWELRDFGEPSGKTVETEYGFTVWDEETGQIDVWNGTDVERKDRTMMDDTFLINSLDQEGTVNTNNVVTAVVFDYRGFDTLGEATVLFAAVTGVLTTIRIAFPKKKEDEEGGEKE